MVTIPALTDIVVQDLAIGGSIVCELPQLDNVELIPIHERATLLASGQWTDPSLWTTVKQWRMRDHQYAPNGLRSLSGAVSGNGWIASDLTLGGTLALTSNQPLSVVGIADVAGGNIGLASDYSQLPNTVSEPFQLLTAHGGIQGMLSTAAGAPLGNNLFLESIVHNPNDITIQVRSEGGILGDFSGNGSVENADLTLLLNNWAGPASPVPAGWIGTPQPTAPAIDNDELTALLNNWGNSSGGGSYTAGAVPEPSSIVLCLSAAIGLLVSIGRGSVTSRQTVHR